MNRHNDYNLPEQFDNPKKILNLNIIYYENTR